MAQVLVRGLTTKVMERLKKRARDHGRSLQGELKLILEQAAREPERLTAEEFLSRAEAIRARTAGRMRTNSAELIREDRAR